MNDFLKQDIFFFLASILVIILTLVVIVVGFYLIRIVKAVKYISEKAKTESDLISEDISDLRENIKDKGVKLSHLANFVGSVYKRHKK
jgi:hypothetical protein